MSAIGTAVLAVGLAVLAVAPGGTGSAPPDTPADVTDLLRSEGPAWLGAAEAAGGPGAGAVTIGPAHAVHGFTAAYAAGDPTATVAEPSGEWVAVWSRDGEPAGLLRVWRPDGSTPEIAGTDGDPATAAAIVAWDGAGDLVEEPWRARWFALEGTTLTTLAGRSYPDEPVAASYGTATYAQDVAAFLAASQAPADGATPAGVPWPVVGLSSAALVVAGVIAGRRRRRPA